MTLAGEQARSRIHPNPARTRQKRFCPGMEIRRVGLRTARTFRRALVRRQLNQIPGDEACRDSQMSENLHQQPGRVTAGARALFKGLLTCLNARIEPRHIFNFVSHLPIQVNQKADRCSRLAARLPKKSLE